MEPGQIAEQLANLGFSTDNRQSESIDVSVPWWRPDVQTEDDLAEEVIKLVGYDQLPATLPAWQPNRISFDRNWPERWQAKAVLRSAGLFEVMTYSFISRSQIEFLGRPLEDHLKLKNPLSSEQDYLRTDLLPSLLAAAERNRTYAKAFGMFEFSKVYLPKAPGELPRESLRLGVLRRGQGDGYPQVKAVLDRLGRTFNAPVRVLPAALNEGVALRGRVGCLQLGDTTVGWIGELDPGLTAQLKLDGGIGYFELDWEPFLAAASPKQYRGSSRFPSAIRDIAVIVPRELAWAEIAAALTNYETHFKSDYYGEGLGEDKKSVAFQLIISYPERTPTDKDAEQVVEAVTNTLRERFNAELRA